MHQIKVKVLKTKPERIIEDTGTLERCVRLLLEGLTMIILGIGLR